METPVKETPYKNQPKRNLLFFGGIPKNIPHEEVRRYFERYGRVAHLKIEKDRHTKQKIKTEGGFPAKNPNIPYERVYHRGCGFLRFASKESTDRVLTLDLILNGLKIDIKRAMSKKERKKYDRAVREELRKIYIGNLDMRYTKGTFNSK